MKNLFIRIIKSKVTYIVLSLIAWSIFVYWFRANYYFQVPVTIKFRPLIERVVKTPVSNKPIKVLKIVTPTPTPKLKSESEILNANKHGEILTKIYQLESSSGKNDYCRNNNKGYGGFGVMYNGEIICYDSFEKAVERAEYWLVNLNVDKNLASALCQWNLGTAGLVNCQYYQDYLSL